MSISLAEVIEAGGYNLESREDAEWLVSKRSEWEDLLEKAYETIDGFELTEEIASGDE